MTAGARVAAILPPTADDEEAIRATIEDYYLGWYDADGVRMARALHPRLAKHGWGREEAARVTPVEDSFATMVDGAVAGHGRRPDPDARRYEVRGIAVHRDIASALVYAVPYVDFLHLVRTPDGWRIIHALWCRP